MVTCGSCGRDIDQNSLLVHQVHCTKTAKPEPMDIDNDDENGNNSLPANEPDRHRLKLNRLRRHQRSIRGAPPTSRRSILLPRASWQRREQETTTEDFSNLQIGNDTQCSADTNRLPTQNAGRNDPPTQQSQRNSSSSVPVSQSQQVVDLVDDDDDEEVVVVDRAQQPPACVEPVDSIQPTVTRSLSNESGSNEIETEWSCSRCTLKNRLISRYCEACGTRRRRSNTDDFVRPPDPVVSDRLVANGGRIRESTQVDDDPVSNIISSHFGYAGGGALLGSTLGTTVALLRGRPLVPAAVEGAVSGAVGGVLVREALDPAVTSSRSRGGAQRGNARRIENPYRPRQQQNQSRTSDSNQSSTAVEPNSNESRRTSHRSRSGRDQRQRSRRSNPRVFTTDDPIFEFIRAALDGEIMVGPPNVEGMSYEQLLHTFGDGTENMGASEELISSLPVARVTEPERLPEDHRKCFICLEDFEKDEERMTLPCLHGFHDNCASKWLLSNASCPICKYQVNGNTDSHY